MELWLESNKVSAVTCERLRSEMVLTLSDLKDMSDQNITDLGLVMGEQIRLKRAIRGLFDRDNKGKTALFEKDTSV